jgi:hydrogenase maturation protein HypF
VETQRLSARRIHITGVVQGVGFRPFVYNLAAELELIGWVLNSSAGVEIEAVGPIRALEVFADRLLSEAPPLARIEDIVTTEVSASDVALPDPGAFVIRHSMAKPGEFQPISPDITICDDCLRELFDPADRRYRYPFINCTNCGPRFTIIKDIPYDRPNTTMAPFKLCRDCELEYDNPSNRRFHAQPNACSVCGPHVWLARPAASQVGTGLGSVASETAHGPIQAVRELLSSGSIIAVKGLGGFHLACDATNDDAVHRLRERKGRVDKPFALMAPDMQTVEKLCFIDECERELLTSRERPIVLLRERPSSAISNLVAPGNNHLGVMLPYTPVHCLLLERTDGFPKALVMTSGNYAEEPIATGNEEALEHLTGLADAFLLHDREIHARCDDSVTRVFRGEELPVRRSRGYAPYPIRLPFAVGQVLAVGAELKNTFCLTRDKYAFLSQHIGDMDNYETLRFFEQMVEQLARTFRVSPMVVAHDMHPGYLVTRWAKRIAESKQELWGAARLHAVQHHHAHIASCMAEHGLSGQRRVLGVAFDGTGYGLDGAIWGGEFLLADYASFQRAAHLKYIPLPGGDEAIRRPYRVALAHLWAAGLPWDEALPAVTAASPTEKRVIAQLLTQGVNTVPTSSSGRLFDAVAALAGVRQEINYEAQAAIELENLVDLETRDAYTFPRPCPSDKGTEQGLLIDPAPVIRDVVADVRQGIPPGLIAARLHNGVARMVRDVCVWLREEHQLNEVVLSGGVFQNVTLLSRAIPLLQEAGFTTYTHHHVPPNDGGLSLGQAVIAAAKSSLWN